MYAEALSSGTPVLALGGTSVADQVLADQTGLVLSTLTEGNITQAIRTIGAESQSLVQNCLRVFQERYTEDAWLSSIRKIYVDAVATRHQRSARRTPIAEF